MKPFDLEAAKQGEPIVCRDGTPAKFIAHVPDANDARQIIVLINNFIFTHYENGKKYPDDSDRDLFMAPKKRTFWVNLVHPYAGDSSYGYHAAAFRTKEQADDADRASSFTRIGSRAWLLEIEE